MAQFKPVSEMTQEEIRAELESLGVEVPQPQAPTPTVSEQVPLEAPVSPSQGTSPVPTPTVETPVNLFEGVSQDQQAIIDELKSLGTSDEEILTALGREVPKPVELPEEEEKSFLEEAGEVVTDIGIGAAQGIRQGLIEFANTVKPLYGLDPKTDSYAKEYTTPDTMSAQFSKTLSKFATGYGLTAPLRGVGVAAKLKGGSAAVFEGAVRSGLGDYIVANEEDSTFASYMADNGSDNPLVLALAINPEDDEKTRKLKVASEGLLFTSAIAGVLSGGSRIKDKYVKWMNKSDDTLVPASTPINTITDIDDDLGELASEAVPTKLSQADRSTVIHDNVVDDVISERIVNLEQSKANLEIAAGTAETANKTPLIKMAVKDIKDLNTVRDDLAGQIDTIQKEMDGFKLQDKTSNEYIRLLNNREGLKRQLSDTLDSIDEYRFSINELDTTTEAYREAMKARMSMGLVSSDALDKAIYKGNAPVATGRDIYSLLEKEKSISKPLQKLADPDLPTKERDLIIDDLVQGRRSRTDFKSMMSKLSANTVGRATDAFSSLSKNSPTAAKFANLLRHDSYKFGKNAGNWSYRESVQFLAGKFKSQYKDALEKNLPDSAWTRGGDLTPEANDYIVRYLRGDTTGDSPYRKAARFVRVALNDFLDKAKEFDPDTGKLENFFPRRYQIGEGVFGGSKQNTKKDFVEYLNSKGIQDEARIEDIMQKIANENDEYLGIFLRDGFEADMGYRGSRTVGGGRTLTELDDLDMEQFLDNDLIRVLDSYFELGARKVTYNDMFGIDGSKARAMMDQMNAELKNKKLQTITVEEESAFKDILKHIQGTDKLRNAGIHATNEALATATRMSTLGATFLTSLVEAALIPGKVGMRRAAKGFAVAASGSAQNVVSKFTKSVPKSEAHRAAHRVDLGLDFAASQRLDALYGGEAITGINRKANEAFFKATFLHQWVQYLQVASNHATTSLITDNLDTLAKGVKMKSKEGFLRKELDSLGVDADLGIEWVKKGKPKDDPFVEQIQRGALRATNDVVINPDATVKPFYMNNPSIKLLTLLKNYPLAFPNTVLRDWYQRVVATDNNYERIVNTSRILSSMLVSYGMWEVSQQLKDNLFYGGDRPKRGFEETPEERFMNFMDTSGYLGVFGFVKHAMDAEKFGKTPLEGLLGPGYQTLTAISELGVAAMEGDTQKMKELSVKGLIERSPQPIATEIPIRLVFDQGSKEFRRQLSGHLKGKELEYTEEEFTIPEVTEPDVPSNPILDRFPQLQGTPSIFGDAEAATNTPDEFYKQVTNPQILGGTAVDLPRNIDGQDIPQEDIEDAVINSGGNIHPFTGEPLVESGPSAPAALDNEFTEEDLMNLFAGELPPEAPELNPDKEELPPSAPKSVKQDTELMSQIETDKEQLDFTKAPEDIELVGGTERANPFLAFSEAEQISSDEGVSKNSQGEHISYLDTEGLLTGGIGHLMTAEEKKQYPEGTVIPESLVNAWFMEDLREADEDLDILLKGKDLTNLPDEAKNVLMNMAFNLGRTRLNKFKKMWKALEEGDYDTAADEMIDSRWYKQVGNRSRRLVARMRSLSNNT